MLHPVECAARCTSREVALDRFRYLSGGCDSSRGVGTVLAGAFS